MGVLWVSGAANLFCFLVCIADFISRSKYIPGEKQGTQREDNNIESDKDVYLEAILLCNGTANTLCAYKINL